MLCTRNKRVYVVSLFVVRKLQVVRQFSAKSRRHFLFCFVFCFRSSHTKTRCCCRCKAHYQAFKRMVFLWIIGFLFLWFVLFCNLFRNGELCTIGCHCFCRITHRRIICKQWLLRNENWKGTAFAATPHHTTQEKKYAPTCWFTENRRSQRNLTII